MRRFTQRHRAFLYGVAGLLVYQVLLLAALYWNRNDTASPNRQVSKHGLPIESNDATGSTIRPLPDPAAVMYDESLVAYWSAEGIGLTARDHSSHGNNGALIGNTSRNRGAVGEAFSFDGDGDYINFGRSSKWNFLHDGSAFSITGYVAPAASNLGGGILATIDETSTANLRHGFSLRLDGSRRLQFHIQGKSGRFPAGAKSRTALRPNMFTAFAVTFDGQTARVFIDGQPDGSGETSGPFVSSTALDALSMGSIGTASGPNGQPFAPFEGLIDEVRVYDRELSTSEIALLAGTNALQSAGIINVVASTFFADGGTAVGTSTTATHTGQGTEMEFPVFPATHTADPADAFLTVSSSAASLHYDFGTSQVVNQLRLWNYHGAAYGVPGNGQGAKDIRIYGSNELAAFDNVWHDSWELLTAVTASQAPADGAVSPYGEEHSFSERAIRFVRIQIDTNYGGENVGLAEVQFVHVP